MSHTIKAAMERGELTEEEAFFLLRFAGRMGYDQAIRRLQNPWKTLRRWFVWFGGWESPELSQWDSGRAAWEFRWQHDGTWRDPFPLSLFGHAITFQSGWVDIRWFGGWVVVRYGRQQRMDGVIAYWSPNATPGHKRMRVLLRGKPQKGND